MRLAYDTISIITANCLDATLFTKNISFIKPILAEGEGLQLFLTVEVV